ncbi:MAG: Hpt domain-containing protein [Treponema sp.]|nr:Hpt domain-containing protein [Treponema sp.]MCL2181402.1 Hpt domain-containing protein [Treponema sp.]
MNDTQVTIDIPGIDEATALSICGRNIGIYISTLRLYVNNITLALEKIRNVTEEDLDNYTARVHGIKGISEYIGAREIRKKAKNLERLAKTGDIGLVREQNGDFVRQVEEMLHAIRNWLEKKETKTP